MTEDRTAPEDGIATGGEDRTADEPGEVQGLIRQARSGDTEAFDQLVTLFQNRVWSVAWRMTGRREDALEVAQEAFLRAYRYLGSFQLGRPFGPWILRITNHAAQDHLRRTRPSMTIVPMEEAAPGDLAREPDEREGERRLLDEERREVLFSLLDRLTERERSVFVLREMQGLDTKEVAETLGIRPVTVRRHAGRARDRLLRILSKEYPELLADGAEPGSQQAPSGPAGEDEDGKE